MEWILKPFQDLTVFQLYALLRLRSEVFIVEQNCVYQDLDNKDEASFHLMGFENNELLAYTRLLPPGISYPYASIGRVVTSPKNRRKGTGKFLMEKSITETIRLFGNQPIKISAQLYLKKFYTSLGFVQASDTYLEDGIEHIEMIRY